MLYKSICRAVISKVLECEAETLLTNVFGYVDFNDGIKGNLKNLLLCLVFTDLVTYVFVVIDNDYNYIRQQMLICIQ